MSSRPVPHSVSAFCGLMQDHVSREEGRQLSQLGKGSLVCRGRKRKWGFVFEKVLVLCFCCTVYAEASLALGRLLCAQVTDAQAAAELAGE
jgi:hypothetical protein